jgi:transcriptional regulator with XRE-family HTH domain
MVQFRLKELIATRQRRTGNKVTYRKLAEETGLSKTTIARVANNQVTVVGLNTIEQLCKFFGADIAELMILENGR